MKIIKTLLLLPALLLGSLLYAHTALKVATPADGAVLNTAPTALELGFTEDVQLLKVELATAAGVAQELGFKPSAAAATTFSVPLPALAPAAYQVSWTILGKDGHRVDGKLGFTVDPAAAEASGSASEHHGH
jgi:methionine-rich copper-binding protein CopC